MQAAPYWGQLKLIQIKVWAVGKHRDNVTKDKCGAAKLDKITVLERVLSAWLTVEYGAVLGVQISQSPASGSAKNSSVTGGLVLYCSSCSQSSESLSCPTDGAACRTKETMDDLDPLLGQQISDRYQIVGRLGSGGFGTVYLAVETLLQRQVALKVLHATGTEAGERRARRFFREAKALACLDYDGCVKIFDYGSHKGRLYMVMQRIHGPTLAKVLKQGGALPPERAVKIAIQVLESVAEAHASGLIHRDLKPANVILTRTPFGEEQVRVLDFGMAKIYADDESLSVEGMGVGTSAYMAPEQSRGAAVPQSDLYAVGIMLYEMLAGRRPFVGSAIETVIKHANDPIPDGLVGHQPILNNPCDPHVGGVW